VKSSIFWCVTECSPLKVNRHFGEISRLHLQSLTVSQERKENEAGNKVSCLAYSPTLKMEVICYSETSVDFERTTRSNITEDIALHIHRCERLKTYGDVVFTVMCELNFSFVI
jgi:hypothetical protein